MMTKVLGGHRKVNKVEVQVVELELLQAIFTGLYNMSMV